MRTFFFTLMVLGFGLNGSSQETYLHCGRLISCADRNVQTEMTVIVEGRTIKTIEKGYRTPTDSAIVIDLRDKTVLPGLMDMHVHIEHESNPKRYEQRFRQNPADVALQATQYCERTLLAGFTTVRDLGGTGVNVSLQTAIARGLIPGPRIYTTEKSIATTGGHADPTNGVRRDLMGDPGPKEGVINGPEDAAKAVRQRYKNGADLIKITATGGVLSVAKDGSGPQFTMEELRAIVQTANDYGMTTAAHAHGAEGMKRAVQAGITSIEHGTYMTEEVMDLMIERGTYYVPTIAAGKFVAEKAKVPGFYPDVVVPKALAIGPQIQETFGKAYRRGVKIAFGTDSGVSYHGDNAREFIYMTEAGMPMIDALLSATIVPAQMLRIDDRLGSLEVGKLADIIAVDDNPLEKVETMLKVPFVMKEGIIYAQPE